MPNRFDYSDKPYEGFNPTDVTDILASAKTLGGMLPNGFEEEARKLKQFETDFDNSGGVVDIYSRPNDPQVREKCSRIINEIAEITKSVYSRLDEQKLTEKYPLQTVFMRNLLFQTNVYNEGFVYSQFTDSRNGPAYIGHGASRTLCMDLATTGWPDYDPEHPEQREQFLADVNNELRDTPLLTNVSAGLDQLENMLIHVQTKKALEKDPDNAELQQKLKDADSKIAESTRYLADHVSEVREFGTAERFNLANYKDTAKQFKYLQGNGVLVSNIQEGRDLSHAVDGSKIMSALLDTGMSVDEAVRLSRGIHRLNTIGPNCEGVFPKVKPTNPEAGERFHGIFERLSAPLKPENLSGTLKYLEENGLTLDNYIFAAEKEISRALKDAYSVNQNGKWVFQDPGMKASPIDGIIKDIDALPDQPGTREILRVGDPAFAHFMDEGYSFGEANNVARDIVFIRDLGQEVLSGIGREKKLPNGAATDPQAAEEFADLHSALAAPLQDANLPDTMQRLKEQGITLEDYLNTAGEQLCEAVKNIYTPKRPDDLLGPVYSAPRDPSMQNIVGKLEGMESSEKAKRFIPEVLVSAPEKLGRIQHKAFDSPVTGLDGDSMAHIMNLCGDRRSGGLGAYIPDLSPQTEKRIQELQIPIMEAYAGGMKEINGRKTLDPEGLRKARPALAELHSIMEKEYERVKESGNNPIAEVQLRLGMQLADCFANGISFSDLDRKTGGAHNPSNRPLSIDCSNKLWDRPNSKYSYEQINNAVKKTPLYDNTMASIDHMDCLIAEEKARRKLSRTDNPDDRAKAQEELDKASVKTEQAAAKFSEQFYKFREFAMDPEKMPEELRQADLAKNLKMGGGMGRGDRLSEDIFRNVDFLVSQGVAYKDAVRYSNAFSEIDLQVHRITEAIHYEGYGSQEATKFRTEVACCREPLEPKRFQETWKKVKEAGIDFEDYLTAVSSLISDKAEKIADSIKEDNEKRRQLAGEGEKFKPANVKTEKALRGVSEDLKTPAPEQNAAEYVRDQMETHSFRLTEERSKRIETIKDSNIGDILHNQELLASKRWYGGRFRSNSDEHQNLTRDVEELARLMGANGSDIFAKDRKNIEADERKAARLEQVLRRIKDHGEAYLEKNGEEASKSTTMGKNRSHSARFFVNFATEALDKMKGYASASETVYGKAQPAPKQAAAGNGQVKDINLNALQDKCEAGAHYRDNAMKDPYVRRQGPRATRVNTQQKNGQLNQEEIKKGPVNGGLNIG